jgi:hypothetical protein
MLSGSSLITLIGSASFKAVFYTLRCPRSEHTGACTQRFSRTSFVGNSKLGGNADYSAPQGNLVVLNGRNAKHD